MQKTTSVHKGNNATSSDILEKLKYRLPMFLLSVHCFVTQSLFGDNIDDKTSQNITLNNTNRIFTIYYLAINIICILWTLWHSIRAYNDIVTKFSYKALGFIICEVCTSSLLFIIISNLSSFNIPFRIIFSANRTISILIYGIAAPIIYFANSIEEVYWSDLSNEYIKIEKKDDIQEDDTLQPKNQNRNYSSLTDKTT